MLTHASKSQASDSVAGESFFPSLPPIASLKSWPRPKQATTPGPGVGVTRRKMERTMGGLVFPYPHGQCRMYPSEWLMKAWEGGVAARVLGYRMRRRLVYGWGVVSRRPLGPLGVEHMKSITGKHGRFGAPCGRCLWGRESYPLGCCPLGLTDVDANNARSTILPRVMKTAYPKWMAIAA